MKTTNYHCIKFVEHILIFSGPIWKYTEDGIKMVFFLTILYSRSLLLLNYHPSLIKSKWEKWQDTIARFEWLTHLFKYNANEKSYLIATHRFLRNNSRRSNTFWCLWMQVSQQTYWNRLRFSSVPCHLKAHTINEFTSYFRYQNILW